MNKYAARLVKDEVLKLFERGWSVIEIAEKFGVSRQAVYPHLNGDTGNGVKGMPPIIKSPEDLERMVQMLNEGTTFQEVAEEFGIRSKNYRAAVLRVLRNHSVKKFTAITKTVWWEIPNE